MKISTLGGILKIQDDETPIEAGALEPLAVVRDHPNPETRSRMLTIRRVSELTEQHPLDIATVYSAPEGGENEQYANVMAAAPELLEALKGCREIMQRVFPNGLPVTQGSFIEEQDWDTSLNDAVKAIAKAERSAR